jgi:hypothetical protein
MQSFKVWLRPSGESCKVRVEGRENACRLREQLGEHGLVCTEVMPVGDGTYCLFRVNYTPDVNHAALERLIAALSGVRLMTDPA